MCVRPGSRASPARWNAAWRPNQRIPWRPWTWSERWCTKWSSGAPTTVHSQNAASAAAAISLWLLRLCGTLASNTRCALDWAAPSPNSPCPLLGLPAGSGGANYYRAYVGSNARLAHTEPNARLRGAADCATARGGSTTRCVAARRSGKLRCSSEVNRSLRGRSAGPTPEPSCSLSGKNSWLRNTQTPRPVPLPTARVRLRRARCERAHRGTAHVASTGSQRADPSALQS